MNGEFPWEFTHPRFIRGHRELLDEMRRRKTLASDPETRPGLGANRTDPHSLENRLGAAEARLSETSEQVSQLRKMVVAQQTMMKSMLNAFVKGSKLSAINSAAQLDTLSDVCLQNLQQQLEVKFFEMPMESPGGFDKTEKPEQLHIS